MTSPLKLVPAVPAPATRVCRKCGDERPAAEFPGFHRQCKACRYGAASENRKLDPDKWAAYMRDWRIAHAPRLLLRNARKRSLARSLPFDLVESDIFIPEFCPVLGLPLAPCSGRMHSNNPTIDRFIDDRGYVRGNITVISWRANCLKRDASVEELETVAAWMRATQQEK